MHARGTNGERNMLGPHSVVLTCVFMKNGLILLLKKIKKKNIYMYRGKQSHLIHLLFAIEITPGEINTYIHLYTIIGISVFLSHCSLLPQQQMSVDSGLIFTTSANWRCLQNHSTHIKFATR